MEYRTNLLAGGFTNLTGTSVSNSGPERTVTDRNAVERQKFYRLWIAYP